MYLFLTIFILVTLFFVIFFHFKKKKVLEKLCAMTEPEKCRLIDDICAPLGYRFDCNQGIFSTRLDAWQRDFGYTYAFDRFAPLFHMVFDAQPVYFNYNGRTWLIEFWKGQYGITTGCEIGIYHADGLIPKKKRPKTLFQVVDNSEILPMAFTLKNNGSSITSLSEPHWWLTGFCLGQFADPTDLSMDINLTFPNCEMLSCFVRAMLDLGYTSQDMSVSGHRLSFTFTGPYASKCNLFCRLIRRISLWSCLVLCKLYKRVVRPVQGAVNQLLYLYFYLPSAFRRVLLLHGRNHKSRKHQRKLYKKTRKFTQKTL